MKGACSEAVGLFLRETHEAQPDLRRLERKYGKDKATGLLAHRLGRPVYDMLTHTPLFDSNKVVNQQQGRKVAGQQGSRLPREQG